MKKFEFSKLIICLVMLTYFVGLGFGMFIIWYLVRGGAATSYVSTALCGLFSYIGAPVAVAIAFYSYKAKAENVEKIRGNVPLVETEEWTDE